MITKLGDFYTDFSRIDLDSRGAYTRVAKVRTLGNKGLPGYCAFKLLRHEQSNQAGIKRFEIELSTLLKITQMANYPLAITKVFDSGFVSIKLSKAIQKPVGLNENTGEVEAVNPNLGLISTGTNFDEFLQLKYELENNGSTQWLPYLVAELAPYNDNLLRQIRALSSGKTSSDHQLSTHEIIPMVLQILDVMDFLHADYNFAYIDWKPGHIYWNNNSKQLKLVDWNVSHQFKDAPERKRFIREDIRLLCGAALYCPLALNEGDLGKIGPEPKILREPLPASTKHWYLTDNPNFYERDLILDAKIKKIVQKGLDPNQGFDSPEELKRELKKYTEQELFRNASLPKISPTSRITKISELYTDFFRIDLDARGGYARVAQAKIVNRPNLPEYCAFKIMRHELMNRQIGMDRFEVEAQTLTKLTNNSNFPSAITKIYDSGFVDSGVSKILQKPDNLAENAYKIEKLDSELGIISAGTDFNAFLDIRSDIEKKSNHWLPYLAVELAPYENSLLRQIRQYSLDPKSYSHIFPIGDVTSMALQLLDVMEYLQQQELAYMDWKPEHIYWDSVTQQVKLIDWNVTNVLHNNNDQKAIIREDIRLFFGATLYCSMALSDPEDMQKPIGPQPKISKNVTTPHHRRYWTDEPNFYERGLVFDDDIKQLVTKGLDPAQGFNTPEDIKNAITQYTIKNSRTSESSYQQPQTMTMISGVPRDAIQNYRRARSYISAGDFQYAMESLQDAVVTSRKIGVNYTDAENLLLILTNRLGSDELKQKAKTAVKDKQWTTALGLYDKALKQDPTNVITSKELDDVHYILSAKVNDLKAKGFLKIFKPVTQLRNLTKAIKNTSGYNTSLIKSVDIELKQINLLRNIFVTIAILFILYMSGIPSKLIPAFTVSNTPSANSQITTSVTATEVIVATSEPVISVTPSIISTSTLTPTSSLTPTPTEIIFGIGYINKVVASAWNEPNRGLIMKLSLYQPVILLERRIVSNSTWFRCRWEINGAAAEGWIIEDNIFLGTPPTP